MMLVDVFLFFFHHVGKRQGDYSRLLPILHLFNDGYLAAMPLILPFASEEFGLSLGIVGILGSLLSFAGIILALPAGMAATSFGAVRILSTAVLCYVAGFLLLGFSGGLVSVFCSCCINDHQE